MISVLLPTYNRPHWLKESMDSVLAQDCDLELLVLDNGSEAETAKVLDWYQDPRVRRFRVSTNGEVSPWDFLAKQARGEYAVFWADDDRMLPGGLRRKLEFLEKHPELGMVWSRCEEIDDSGRPKGTARVGAISERQVLDIRTATLLNTCYIANTSALVRSQYLRLYQECIRFSPVADWAFWLEVASFGMGVGFIPEETIQLRLHEGSGTSYSRKTGEFREAFLKVWEHWLSRGLKLGDDEWNLVTLTYASFRIETGWTVEDALSEAKDQTIRLRKIKWSPEMEFGYAS